MRRILGTQPKPTCTVVDAKHRYAAHREAAGLWPGPPRLTTAWDGQHKFRKTEVPTIGLALAPSDLSGINVCPRSTPACRPPHCVAMSGKGGLDRNVRVRVMRTTFLAADPEAFLCLLAYEIDCEVLLYGHLNVRLNEFSDLEWEVIAPWLFERWPTVTFYDYTKIWERQTPANYRLTLSASNRTSLGKIAEAVDQGREVAVVVSVRRSEPMPSTFHGRPMIDGDKTDDRTNDRGVVIGLRPKGTMGKSAMVFDIA
jgi:hypothetical protein